ncbi:hypothetical protein [Virgibacillus sp. SK37]|uniref:hypothetical protein n=1 Tax=Virgibacillus sp. SK37 TaxID=403957 RepID=UPI0004D1E55C|nr:hypothetical protein [Virgibacillus sp. SK37]AIF45673.1 hypothetical protein X953_18975 [Virgibacillus sp. SK37]
MELLKELKERVTALYKQADELKCNDTFQEAMDLETHYDMTVLYHNEQFPTD